MKYHKIRNVPLEVCTAEQVIAYNYAFAYYDKFEKEYKIQVIGLHKSDIAHEFVRFCLDCIKNNQKIMQRYDIDAIFSCLMAGREKYLEADYHILTSYKEVGEMFPALYL